MNRRAIFDLINAERKRQNEKHPNWKGGQKALSVLTEEVGEIAHALNEIEHVLCGEITEETADILKELKGNLREEIVQTISVGVRWLENLPDD